MKFQKGNYREALNDLWDGFNLITLLKADDGTGKLAEGAGLF